MQPPDLSLAICSFCKWLICILLFCIVFSCKQRLNLQNLYPKPCNTIVFLNHSNSKTPSFIWEWIKNNYTRAIFVKAFNSKFYWEDNLRINKPSICKQMQTTVNHPKWALKLIVSFHAYNVHFNSVPTQYVKTRPNLWTIKIFHNIRVLNAKSRKR